MLGQDIAELAANWVSVVLVSDPFSGVDPRRIHAFDVCLPFNQHYVVDLSLASPSPHHRREARRSRRFVDIAQAGDKLSLADDWVRLYQSLIRNKGVTTAAAFPDECLRKQLLLSDCRAYVAYYDGEVCAMALWLIDGDVAYYHLAASATQGYKVAASYGLMDAALEDLATQGIERISLGGAPAGGRRNAAGLAYFKSGWATDHVPTYVCGKILDSSAYRRLSVRRARQRPTTDDFFPAYRRSSDRYHE
ncbi:MAG: GNAT family N-acetyltransferase [Lysobacteraceae bacterium]